MNINKEKDTCNKDNYNGLKEPHIKNKFEEDISEINIHEKDKDKEGSREDKEVNVVENEKKPIKEK